MPPDGFKCKQCGNCCLNLNGFSTCASDADVRRWEAAGRTDILEWVDTIEVGDQRIYDIWIEGTYSSRPRNKLIAQIFYDLEIIERYGSGIGRIDNACREAGLPLPRIEDQAGGFTVIFSKAPTGEVTPPVEAPVTPPVETPVGEYVRRLLVLLLQSGALGNAEIRGAFGLKDRRRLRETYIDPALGAGLVEMTIPDKPNSRLQKYRLTAKGRELLSEQPS